MRVLLFLSILLVVSCTHKPVGTGPIIPDVTLESACDSGYVDFTNEVLPLIKSSCATIGCHDDITQEDGYRLTSYSGIISDGELVIAGNHSKSDLYKVITENPNDGDFMPPINSGIAALTPEQINMLKRWINEGALETDCGCDTTSFSFAADVKPIFDLNCVSCHNENISSGNLSLTNYNEISTSILNGNTLDRISRPSGTAGVMPTTGKMDDCNITIIEKWIENGIQDD